MKADAELIAQQAFWAGQHALPLFFVLLALALATTWAGWWMLRPSSVLRRQRFPRPNSPKLALGLRTAFGITTLLLGAGFFTVLAGQLDVGLALGLADQVFTDALRVHVPPAALQVFAMLTHLADTAILTGLCIGVAMALVALGRPWLAFGWVVAVAGNSLLNHSLKQVFARARPLHSDGLALVPGFSFPSGHSSGVVVAYGMLAYLALRLLPAKWHLPALLTAVAIAFSVGASRLFLRVHFASDVFAGFTSGAAWLALCIASMELLRRTAKG
jgi:undecaprenyl-diphosphatase